MRRGGGKAKGSSYEREKCKQLSRWLDPKRDDIFWRSAMSGGRATVNKQARIAQSGDISAIDPKGVNLIRLFVLECKRYKNFEFDRLLNGGKSGFRELWDKLFLEARRVHRIPLMLCRANHGVEMIVTTERGSKALVHAQRKDRDNLVPLAILVQFGIYFYKLDEVFAKVDGKALRKPKLKRKRLS